MQRFRQTRVPAGAPAIRCRTVYNRRHEARQFLSRLRHYGRKTGRTVTVDVKRGKGSHATVIVDDQATIIQAGELSPQQVKTILRPLGLPAGAFD